MKGNTMRNKPQAVAPKLYLQVTTEELAHIILALDYVDDVKYVDAPEVIKPLLANLAVALATAHLN
jgi:hypothetical protein